MNTLNSHMYNQAFSNSAQNESGEQALRMVLTDWIYKNIHIPGDTQSLVALAVLLLSAWLIIGWMMRLVMAIIWPITLTILFAIIYPCLKETNIQILLLRTFNMLKDIGMKIGILISKLMNART